MSRKCYNIRFLPLVFFFTITLGTFLHLRSNFKTVFQGRDDTFQQINNYIRLHKSQKEEHRECVFPILDVSDPNIILMMRDVRTERCGSMRDWVEVDGSTAKISNWAKENLKDVECSIKNIYRQTEELTRVGKINELLTEYTLNASDVVGVVCTDSNKTTWNKILLGVRSDKQIYDRSSWSKVPEDSLKLNVLIIGLDSLSHNMWRRKLPKTYKYATKVLGGIALNGYNVVGDGTLSALLPILTGKTQLELPETRKSMGSEAQFLDVYPFIWKEFKNNGYVTLFGEDHLALGTFSSRLKGFERQPVDHYPRAFYLSTKPALKERNFCYGQLSKLEIMTNYVSNMYKVYRNKPKFMFIFYGEYTYDNLHYTSNADGDLYGFLQMLRKNESLNDTLLILMSDHGSRTVQFKEGRIDMWATLVKINAHRSLSVSSVFATECQKFKNALKNTYYRSTQQGKQEERLPGFIFIFPNWFKSKYPEAFSNLQDNGNRLTTPFDIHETLKNVIHYRGTADENKGKRGISLFKKIPLSRSCRDAQIDFEWCTCLDWEKVQLPSAFIKEAAITVVKLINEMLFTYNKICGRLRLKTLVSCYKMFPNEYLLRFKLSDRSGTTKDLTDVVSVKSDIYRLIIILSPGDMSFEAKVLYQLYTSRFYVSERYIKRIDSHNETSHCLGNKKVSSYVRKFCFCK